EEQRAVHVCQAGGKGAIGNLDPMLVMAVTRRVLRTPGVDVLDQDGAGGRAVALPQLNAVGPVIGRHEERPIDQGQLEDADLLDQDGAGGGTVALPQVGPTTARCSAYTTSVRRRLGNSSRRRLACRDYPR